MALTHLALVLLTNSVTKWKNTSTVQQSSAITVKFTSHSFAVQQLKLMACCLIIDRGQFK